jgi:hypothetical protein
MEAIAPTKLVHHEIHGAMANGKLTALVPITGRRSYRNPAGIANRQARRGYTGAEA